MGTFMHLCRRDTQSFDRHSLSYFFLLELLRTLLELLRTLLELLRTLLFLTATTQAQHPYKQQRTHHRIDKESHIFLLRVAAPPYL